MYLKLTSWQLLKNSSKSCRWTTDVVTYFEHTYIRGRRRPGDNYGPAIFPIPVWNPFNSAGDGIARTTNTVECWHYSLQSLFMCQHPTVWTFFAGIARDCSLYKAAYLESTTGVVTVGKKQYRDLIERVTRAVASYGTSDILDVSMCDCSPVTCLNVLLDSSL